MGFSHIAASEYHSIPLPPFAIGEWRGGVRGGGLFGLSAGESVGNDGHDALDVGNDIAVPESQDAIAARLQKFASPCVGDHLSALGVAGAINLDDQSVGVTAKVRKVGADRR